MIRDRAGAYKTNLSGEAAYSSFAPAPLPPDPPISLDGEGMELLISANKRLALLEGIAARIPDVRLFISMYVRKEALISSQIEGTQATLEDVLDPVADANANLDVAEVVNYVRATEYAVSALAELPLCNRLIKNAHAVLMEGTRGHDANPGEFRHSQNWLGGRGSTIRNARYIPPNVEDMTLAVSDLEKYMNNDGDTTDVLVKAALIHYQFETIHPFLDGNGRMGRLLIILYLMSKGALSTPVLYISYYLKKNRVEYYDRLGEVRRNGDYEQWVKFFLRAVCETAEDAIRSSDTLIRLHEKNFAIVRNLGRAAKTASLIFAYIERNPIIDIQKTADALGITFKTASASIRRLCDAGILTQSAGERRNRTFVYAAYLDVLREGT